MFLFVLPVQTGFCFDIKTLERLAKVQRYHLQIYAYFFFSYVYHVMVQADLKGKKELESETKIIESSEALILQLAEFK